MDETPHQIGEITTSDTIFDEPAEWYQNTEKTISYKNLTSVPNDTVLFTAVWEPIRYTVHFNLNKDTYREDCVEFDADGKCPVTSATVIAGTMSDIRLSFDISAKLPNNAFNLEGYHFIGWSTEKNNSKGSRTCTTYEPDTIIGYKTLENECLWFENEQENVKNLTTVDNDEITLYAQ